MIRPNRSIRRYCALLVALIAFAVLAPAGAFAQDVSPTDEEYGSGVLGVAGSGDSGNNGDEFAGQPTATASDSGISELPFTGLDVAAIAAIGLGLVGTGFAVRKAARSGQEPI